MLALNLLAGIARLEFYPFTSWHLFSDRRQPISVRWEGVWEDGEGTVTRIDESLPRIPGYWIPYALRGSDSAGDAARTCASLVRALERSGFPVHVVRIERVTTDHSRRSASNSPQEINRETFARCVR